MYVSNDVIQLTVDDGPDVWASNKDLFTVSQLMFLNYITSANTKAWVVLKSLKLTDCSVEWKQYTKEFSLSTYIPSLMQLSYALPVH